MKLAALDIAGITAGGGARFFEIADDSGQTDRPLPAGRADNRITPLRGNAGVGRGPGFYVMLRFIRSFRGLRSEN